jgi:uncharacterized protein YjbI with pentapeptide repeats
MARVSLAEALWMKARVTPCGGRAESMFPMFADERSRLMTQAMPLANSRRDEPSPLLARREELQAAFAENCRAGSAPYANVSIRTLSELHWIMDERDWAGTAHARGSQRADFRKAQLSGANLNDADLFEADLRSASCEDIQLCRASLRWANLQGIQLRNGDLRRAILFGANLQGADLRQACFVGANLSGTDARDADFTGADLRDVSFRGADLTGARLDGALLDGADFFDAQGTPILARHRQEEALYG